MTSLAEIAKARAVSMPWLVGRDLPLHKESGGLYRAQCPFHADSTPSLVVYPDHGWCFGCGIYVDPIDWLRRVRKLDFAAAVAELVGGWQPGGTRTPPQRVTIAEKAPRETVVPSLVSELWRTAAAPRLAQMYLESRGIAQKALPTALRGHRHVWCQEAADYIPAMIAAVTDAAGRLTAIERIYLSLTIEYDGKTEFPKGARRLDLCAGKKGLGPQGSGAVKLAAAGEILGLSEGVESALAAAALYRLPVWSTCGAGRLGAIELPAEVRHVVVFADRGKTGEQMASKAETIYRKRGYGCQVEYPERGDWAEMLL